MTQQQWEKRKERAENGVFVISQTEEGFRVYNPAYPTKSYIVGGTPEAPTCTCPHFEYHQNDPGGRCKHILAVLERVAKPDSCVPQAGSYEDEERAAIQEGEAKPKKRKATPSNGTPQMLIKRSVSPDGRIHSLSVEFSCPVDNLPTGEIRSQAERILTLQSEVLESFLSRNGNGGGKPTPPNNNGAIPTQMLSIGGFNGKRGRGLFITVQVNGQNLKFFGSKKELTEAITTAGFPNFAANVAEGVRLNLPCMVVTKPSGDGRYINIEKILPVQMPQPQPQRGWRP